MDKIVPVEITPTLSYKIDDKRFHVAAILRAYPRANQPFKFVAFCDACGFEWEIPLLLTVRLDPLLPQTSGDGEE